MREGESVVAVGTSRAPKLRAVRGVLSELQRRFPDFLPGEIRIEARSVPSGVSSTPRSSGESMRGARHRGEAAFRELRAEGRSVSLGIGLEGGVASEGSVVFLESWAYVTDGERGYFGSSGAIPLPAPLAESVFASGEDLGPAADEYFQRHEVAAREGTFGILTGMMVSREEAFARSLIHALAPFYNVGAYIMKDRL